MHCSLYALVLQRSTFTTTFFNLSTKDAYRGCRKRSNDLERCLTLTYYIVRHRMVSIGGNAERMVSNDDTEAQADVE